MAGATTDAEPKGGGTATELEEEEIELEESFHARESGLFLRMLLGPINVRAARKDGRFKVKEEYNAYRVSAVSLPLTSSFRIEGILYKHPN